jgi:hypothetical protein
MSAARAQELAAKLSHELPEVRVRALGSILFKLQHKLLKPIEFCMNREGIDGLLRWLESLRPEAHRNAADASCTQMLEVLRILANVKYMIFSFFQLPFNCSHVLLRINRPIAL